MIPVKMGAEKERFRGMKYDEIATPNGIVIWTHF